MKALIVEQAGAAPRLKDIEEPVSTTGAHVYELVGAGLHQIVRSLAAGHHYGSAGFPMVPGVDAVARDADGRLVYTGGPAYPSGTMAQRMATPFALPLPGGADPLEVAAGMNPAMSGWLPLVTHRQAAGGTLGTVLVVGATGASGSLAVRAALHLGATHVIAAGRNGEAVAGLEALGAVGVNLAADDPAAGLRADFASTGGAPALVLDYVWGPVAESAFAALARSGLDEDNTSTSYVQIGTLAGSEAAVPGALLRSRKITISGSGAGSASIDRIGQEVPRVMRLFADGVLALPYRAFPLSRAAEAWAYTGRERVVIVPD